MSTSGALLSRRAGPAVLAALAVVVGLALHPAAGRAATTPRTSGPAATATSTIRPADVAGGGAPAVTVTGHGFGHGRGMGQYGALGYALGSGWTYHQILDHFYGGTVPATAPAGVIMTVDITANDGGETIVSQPAARMTLPAAAGVTCVAGSACAVRLRRTGPQHWQVFQGTACDGGPAGWRLVGADVVTASIPVLSADETATSPADMLQLCGPTGTRWLRGDIWAVDTGSAQATVNHLPLESYVRGVVPNESPAIWGQLGGGAGQQALMAQAVAARSYAVADDFAAYAKTCDSTACQVYGGRAFQAPGGDPTDREGVAQFAATDQATASTAGEIRVFAGPGTGAGTGGPAGTVARTEYSSSTGGYSAGGVFPAVVDVGDAVAGNPNHNWTAQVPVSAIESAYGSGKGALVSLEVTTRNGLGDLGGRVTSLTIAFTGGSATDTGDGFAAIFNLPSNWFALGGGPGAPAPGGLPAATGPQGYLVLGADGTVTAFNGARTHGSLTAGGVAPVSLASTPGGYDVLGSNGGVYTFGSATWYGSLKSAGISATPVALATTPDGRGYWIAAADGRVFSFGDAAFHGAIAHLRLVKPVVAMAATPGGGGYWLVTGDGGTYTFGDAAYYGAAATLHPKQPMMAIARTADGGGYWVMDATGGIFSFGDAAFAGSLPGLGVGARAAAMTGAGAGYLVATAAGRVYGFKTPAGPPSGPAAVAGAPPVAIALAR